MKARLDKLMKLCKNWIKTHPDFDFCLQTRLPWSKTVTDPHESLWQIVVGGDDWQLDVILNFAKYLELK